MNLRKFQRGYLGAQDDVLDERSAARCADTEIFQSFVVGLPGLITDESGDLHEAILEPRVCKITDTTVMVLYRLATGVTLFANVITVNADADIVSVGDAQVISTGGSTSYGGSNIVYLEDNKILCGYLRTGNTAAAVVLNVSGDTITAATAVDVSTTSAYGAYLSPVRLELVTTGATWEVLATYINTNNGRLTCQIWAVSAIDVVTFGTEARNDAAGNNFSHAQSALLDPTRAVTVGQSGSRILTEVLDISGTTVTWTGTSYVFLNATQLAGGFSIDHPSIVAIDSLSVAITASVTTTTSDMTSIFVADVDSSDVITSTTVTIDSAETGTNPRVISVGGFPTTIFRDPGVSPAQTMRMLQHTLVFDPPSNVNREDLVVAPAGVAQPEHANVLDPLAFAVYEHTDTTIGLVPYKFVV